METTIPQAPRKTQATNPAPSVVYWEAQKEIQKGTARLDGQPLPLKSNEARLLIDQIWQFEKPYPILIFEGSNPFERRDLFELIRHAADRELTAIVAADPRYFTDENLQAIKNAGAKGIALTLDSPPDNTKATNANQAIFFLTLRSAQMARLLGLQVRLFTNVTRDTAPKLPQIFRLARRMGARIWNLRFPNSIPPAEHQLSAADFEAVLNFVYDASAFQRIEVSEPQHYARIAAERIILTRKDLTAEILGLSPLYDQLKSALKKVVLEEDLIGRNTTILDTLTDSFERTPIHISSGGEVHAEGFANRTIGNVRYRSLTDLYRNSWFFVALRSLDQNSGKCGICEFTSICGGANERAYIQTGDSSAHENFCSYVPYSFPFHADLNNLLRSVQRVQ
jgi:MoaA/NifB/PqqE/SkfB family radical SAM enzyme